MTYTPGYIPPTGRTTAASYTNALAVVSLVFGILSWCVLPMVGAIVAIVCGHLARAEIRRAPAGLIGGDGLAVAGLVLGYVHLLLCMLVLMVVLGAIALGFGLHWM